MDWSHQKIPYFSVPPAIHPSMTPSTIPSTAGGFAAVAPGAETVGQAQILTEFSKPFELAGLFGATDEGAFAWEEVTMGDDTPLRLPLKRSHSPGPGFGSEPGTRDVTQLPTWDAWSVRTPRWFRRAKDPSAYEEAAAESHPLREKTLKKDVKKVRRAARQGRVGMEVDELRDTFMTKIDGRRVPCISNAFLFLDATGSLNLASSTRLKELRATKTSTC